MVAQAARVVGRGTELAAKRIHAHKRRGFRRVAKIIGVTSPGKGRTGGGLHGDKTDIVFPFKTFRHKRRDQTAQVGAAAGAANDDIGLDTEFIKRRFGLQTDNRLVHNDMVEYAAEHIPAVFCLHRGFQRF